MTERTYTIPLRKAFMRTKPYKKTKRAVNEVRNFLKHHMKSDDVRIGNYINLKLWKHGAKNPPPRIQVKVTKSDDNIVHAELVGAPEPVEEKTKEQGKVAATNTSESVVEKKETKSPEQIATEKNNDKPENEVTQDKQNKDAQENKPLQNNKQDNSREEGKQ